MKFTEDKGFSFVESLVVIVVIGFIAVVSWGALSGWRERNALVTVSQDTKYQIDKYRQRAVDKGYFYGFMFSDDGIYVFEDSGGTGGSPFLNTNNMSVDSGEQSDKSRGFADGTRDARRVTDTTSEFDFFAGGNPDARIMIMTTATYDLTSGRSGGMFSPIGVEITDQAMPNFSGSTTAPFDGGTRALFFGPDGMVYLKDPTVPVDPIDRYQSQLGIGATPAFCVIRIAFDRQDSAAVEVPFYYEIAVNRYGATTYTRWVTMDGGTSWNAEIQ
jgi:prepilin-type N-terminal cleavage/methylation domain-containing protein